MLLLSLKTLRAVTLLSILLLSACTTNTPNNIDYQSKVNTQLNKISEWKQLNNARPTGYLNDLIKSNQLDTLISKALKANAGLQQTLLTLKIRQQEQRQTTASHQPSVDAGASASKSEDSNSSFKTSISVSWEVDVWKKLSDKRVAASKETAAQQALYQSARDTLTAEVMKVWLELIADNHAISIEQKRLISLKKNQSLIKQRYLKGLGSLKDLDSARSSTFSSHASLESYQENLKVLSRSLQQMLGETGTGNITLPSHYPTVLSSFAGLPRQTLQRRPDLKAAYLNIQAAQYHSKAAYKDLLPSFSLQAALEDIGSSPSKALLSDPLWSLLSQLTAPLFDGGKLKASAKISELTTAQKYQTYKATLLTAATEVDNALSKERSLTKRQENIKNALKHSKNSYKQYESGYRKGLVDILDLLSIQQQSYDLEVQLDKLIYQRLTNRVDLGLALGLGVHQ